MDYTVYSITRRDATRMVRKAQAPSRGRFPKESGEQVQLFKWAAQFNTLNTLLFAIPNGGGRHPAEAVHLRRQGVKAGVPRSTSMIIVKPVGRVALPASDCNREAAANLHTRTR